MAKKSGIIWSFCESVWGISFSHLSFAEGPELESHGHQMVGHVPGGIFQPLIKNGRCHKDKSGRRRIFFETRLVLRTAV